MHVTFDHSEEAAKNIRTFWFKPDKKPRYTAGQFTEIRLPHDKPDGRGDKRWFTLSSSPSEDMVSITTKFAGDKSSSFKQTLFAMEPGTKLTIADAMGDFVLPKQTDIPIVFVAGGIGVTPMRSMVKWLVDTGEKRSIHLLYAANTLEEVAFRDLFEAASITFEMTLKEPPAGWTGRTGSLTSDIIYALPGVQENALVYFSGPEPMIETFYKELKAKGVDKHRMVTDYFPGYPAF